MIVCSACDHVCCHQSAQICLCTRLAQSTFILSFLDLHEQVGIGQMDNHEPESWFHGLVLPFAQHIYQQPHSFDLKILCPCGQIGLIFPGIALHNTVPAVTTVQLCEML